MILYIFISYLVMLGMIVQANKKDTEAFFMLLFSPFILPIIIGMTLHSYGK